MTSSISFNKHNLVTGVDNEEEVIFGIALIQLISFTPHLKPS